MMEDHARDDAGETSAVKSSNHAVKQPDQDIVSHEACGHYLIAIGVEAKRANCDSLSEHGLRPRTLHIWTGRQP